MNFFFFSPLDQMPVSGATLQGTVAKAKEYLGKEDWEGSPVTRIVIYQMTIITEVKI